MVRCRICGKEFEDDKALHRHLRSHKTLVVDYYHAYHPRKDMLTGDLIKFKNKNQYFSDDFNSRVNMKKWFQSAPKEDSKKYCHEYIANRISKKGIKYTPCEVEVRSLMCPPIPFLQTAFDGYYGYCSENFGLINKYTKYPEGLTLPEDVGKDDLTVKINKIYIDTREQKPLKFDFKTQVETLKYGDYAFSNSSTSMNTYIERKSITDFIGTMSGGFERFKREIERAREDDAKLIVLVEEDMNNCLSFKFLPYVSKKIKASPEFIFHNVRELLQSYDNLHFLFVKGRLEATRVIQKIFTNANKYHKIDLQLAYDLRKL